MIGNRKEITNWLMNQDDNEQFEIKKKSTKRSQNINDYMWVLLQELALTKNIQTSRQELYQEYIHKYGIFKTLTISNNAVSTITHLWKEKGLGWLYDIIDKDDEETTLHLYYGTSSYSNKQMSKFVDMIVIDCESAGIETLTPEHLQRLKDEWKK